MPLRADMTLVIHPSVLLANALAAFALNLARSIRYCAWNSLLTEPGVCSSSSWRASEHSCMLLPS